jgi:hypothetical protein
MGRIVEHPDCGDNSCLFAEKKGGMRTNGGCRCFCKEADDRKAFRELYRYARQLRQALREAESELRDLGYQLNEES